MNAMPPEVLIHVFQLLHASSAEVYGELHVSLVLSQVSGAWRSLAISITSLWTTVTVFAASDLELPRLYAFRSDQHPLRVIVDLRMARVPSTQAQVDHTADFVLAELYRIQYLTVVADHIHHLADFFADLAQVSALALEALRISFDDDGTEPFPVYSSATIFGGGSPTLRSFIARGVGPSFFHPPLATITRLQILDTYAELRMEYEDYVELLHNLPQLQHLVLHGSVVLGIGQALTEDPVRLDNLVSLRLISADTSGLELLHIMRSICAPGLTSLMLERLSHSVHDQLAQYFSQRPQSWLGFPLLETLVFLECAISSTDYIRCLETLPSIHHLTVLGAPDNIIAETLEALGFAAVALSPNLETITLPDTTSPHLLLALANHRRDSGHALQRLSMRGNGSTRETTCSTLDAVSRCVSLEFVDHDLWYSLEDLLRDDALRE